MAILFYRIMGQVIYLFLYKFHLLVFLFDGVGQDGKNEEFSPQLMSLSQVLPIRFFFYFFIFFLFSTCCSHSYFKRRLLQFEFLGSWFSFENLSFEFFLLISPINLLLVLSFLLTPNNTQIQSNEEGFIYVQMSYLVLILPRMYS